MVQTHRHCSPFVSYIYHSFGYHCPSDEIQAMKSANIISRIAILRGVTTQVKFRSFFNLLRIDATCFSMSSFDHIDDEARIISQPPGKFIPAFSNVL